MVALLYAVQIHISPSVSSAANLVVVAPVNVVGSIFTPLGKVTFFTSAPAFIKTSPSLFTIQYECPELLACTTAAAFSKYILSLILKSHFVYLEDIFSLNFWGSFISKPCTIG